MVHKISGFQLKTPISGFNCNSDTMIHWFFLLGRTCPGKSQSFQATSLAQMTSQYQPSKCELHFLGWSILQFSCSASWTLCQFCKEKTHFSTYLSKVTCDDVLAKAASSLLCLLFPSRVKSKSSVDRFVRPGLPHSLAWNT